MSDPAGPNFIKRGTCHCLFVYDVGLSIKLDEAQRKIIPGTSRDTMAATRRAPQTLEYQQAPLRVSRPADPIDLGLSRTEPMVDTVLFEFGAVLVSYAIPLRGSLDNLLGLSECLYSNASLLTDSRERVRRLLDEIRGAVFKPNLADAVEDYVLFEISDWPAEIKAGDWVTGHRTEIAQILRSERMPLSEQEIQDALSFRVSYSDEDATIVDWNAAMIIDREAAELRRVMEFANVELLETRFLDHQLDRALDEAYEVLARRRWSRLPALRSSAADIQKIAGLQLDNAILFEGISNALKLLGDQYLARVYRLASHRFHLEEWDATILRKLGTLESIYQKMADHQANRRMELLEWLIIILFVVSIAISLISTVSSH